MDNKKKYFIIASVVVLIILIAIIIVNNNRKKGATHSDELKDEMIDYVVENNKVLRKISDFSNLGSIKTCVQIYYQSLILTNQENNEYALMSEGDSEYYKNKLYNILSDDYIEKNKITKDSLHYDKLVKDFYVEILSLYKVSEFEGDEYSSFGNVDLYIVNGIMRNEGDKSSEAFSMALATDNVNRTFKVWPSDYVEISKYTDLKAGDKVDFEIPKEIEANDYNKFSTNFTSNDDLARMEFNTVVDLIAYDTEKAYELLSETGKAAFGSLSELEQFRDENKSKLLTMSYDTNTLKVEDGVLTLDCYDSSYTFKISIVFDEFSSFTYSIEKIK